MKRLKPSAIIAVAFLAVAAGVQWNWYPTVTVPQPSNTFLIGTATTNQQITAANVLAWNETNVMRRVNDSNFVSSARLALSNFVSIAQVRTQLMAGFVSVPFSGGTNYWFDCNGTNAYGVRSLYTDIAAEGNVNFVGVTNASRWDLFSFAIIPVTTVNVTFPTNLFHMHTNGFTLVDTRWSITVQGNRILRGSFQVHTNSSYELLCESPTDQ